MQQYSNNLTDAAGNAIPFAAVTVYDENGAKAQLFSDKDGTTPIDNPVKCDVLGRFAFHAKNGRYFPKVAGVGIAPVDIGEILLYDGYNAVTALAANDKALEEAIQIIASDSGSANVGNGGESVADSLNALQLADYTALRAYAGARKSVYVASPGVAGMYVRDDSDTSTADNGALCIVSANGARRKRVTGSNTISTAWFQILGDGSTETAKWQSAIDVISAAGGGILRAEPGKTYITGKLTPKSNVRIDLNGSTLKLANGANAPLLYDNGAGNGTRFGIGNGTLDCNQANNNGLNVLGGVWLTNWTYLAFDDLTITNCPRIGLNLHGVRFVKIRNYQFTNSGLAGTYFAYALSLEDGGGFRSRYVEIDGMSVTSVVGFGIHFYRCDDFTARNLNFDTLTYSTNLAIAVTFTEANRGEVANVTCNAVGGDNIEINDSSDILLDNVDVTAAGNRALLLGQNTAPNYNYRIKVARFKATGTLGSVACALSACINCDFERLDMDLGVNVASNLTSSGNNRIRDSSFGVNAASGNGIISLGWFTLDRVAFLDYTYRYLGKQKAAVSLAMTIANTSGVYSIDPTAMLPGIFSGSGFAAGTLKTASYLSGSANQGSFQKVDFFLDNFSGASAAANLGTVTTVNSQIGRALTITGDATNKKINLTNATAVDLKVAIDLEFTTYI